MADVVVRMSSENAELVRGWLEARRGVQQYEQELDKVGRAGKRAGAAVKDGMKDGESMVAQFGSSIKGLAAGLVSVSAVSSMIKAEYEAWIARRKESGSAQVTFGQQLAL